MSIVCIVFMYFIQLYWCVLCLHFMGFLPFLITIGYRQEGTTWSKLFRGVTSRQPARQTARFIWDQNYAPSLIVVLSARKIWKSIAAVLKSVIFYQQKKQKSYHRDRFFALFQWLCVRTSLKLHIRPRKRVVFLSKKIVTFRFCRPGHYS